ncbi:MAG: YbaB/EbfC family nucleoid-associated protein [Spirochaetaceae bacterium]|jgi:DNA-binding YbaB/EbfC family protein|nr:YbaB/EbfC family nucleoid-associated protein [Spirochaetaceae bacterium]
MNINPLEFMKNFQKMQEQFGSVQDKLGSIHALGSAGGGMVEIEISGKMEVLAVRIKPEAVDPSDVAMLEDLITAAMTNAQEKVREEIAGEISSMTGGMGIPLPGLFGQT